MCDREFKNKLNQLELAAWGAFELVVQNFLGNHRTENYAELVDNMLKPTCVWVAECLSKFTSCILILISFHLIWERLAINMAKGFIKTFQRWKLDIKDSLTQTWRVITVGFYKGRPVLHTSEKASVSNTSEQFVCHTFSEYIKFSCFIVLFYNLLCSSCIF